MYTAVLDDLSGPEDYCHNEALLFLSVVASLVQIASEAPGSSGISTNQQSVSRVLFNIKPSSRHKCGSQLSPTYHVTKDEKTCM